MPTYEYQCRECGHTWEVEQRMSDAPLSRCEQCGGPAIRLVSGGAGVIMKGGLSDPSAGPRCGNASPCCGREVRCDRPPCER
jgi:putative FmdB family regulatory protein